MARPNDTADLKAQLRRSQVAQLCDLHTRAPSTQLRTFKSQDRFLTEKSRLVPPYYI